MSVPGLTSYLYDKLRVNFNSLPTCPSLDSDNARKKRINLNN